MEISKMTDKSTLTLALAGQLDTNTAAGLAKEIDEIGAEIKKLVLDLSRLEYISSAGLRVLLIAQKKMNKQGAMLLRNVGENVMEVFEISGFSDILVIE